MASSSLQQEKGNNGEQSSNTVLKKGTWSSNEDQLLKEYVEKYGARKWDSVKKKTKLIRDGKSCRLRWLNHLKPSVRKSSFSEEEERKLVYLYRELGAKWSQMIPEFPGRTDNQLKNFINSKNRSLKNSGKPLLPKGINHVDELNDTFGEINMMSGFSNQENNTSQEEEMDLPKVELDHQDILDSNYLDQIYGEENINNFEQHENLVDRTNIRNDIMPLPMVPDFPPLPEFSYFQDMEYTLPSLSSCNMFCDQDLPPIPNCSYTQDIDYQLELPSLSSKMFSNHYSQNPTPSSQETEYEMLESNTLHDNGYLESVLCPPKNLKDSNASDLHSTHTSLVDEENKAISMENDDDEIFFDNLFNSNPLSGIWSLDDEDNNKLLF